MTTQWIPHNGGDLPPVGTVVLVHAKGRMLSGRVGVMNEGEPVIRAGNVKTNMTLKRESSFPWWWSYPPAAPEGAPPAPPSWSRQRMQLPNVHETDMDQLDEAIAARGVKRACLSTYEITPRPTPVRAPDLDAVVYEGRCVVEYQSWDDPVLSDPLDSPTLADVLLAFDKILLENDYAHHVFLEGITLCEPVPPQEGVLPRLKLTCGS